MPDYKDHQFWIKEIGRSHVKREHYAKKQEWETVKGLLDADILDVTLLKETTESNPQQFQYTAFSNWVHAYSEIFIPAVYWRHPLIQVRPMAPRYISGAKFVKPVVNTTMKVTKFRVACRKALRDVLCCGHGWVKVGWYTKFGQVPPTANVRPGTGKGLSNVSRETYLMVDAPYAYRVPPDKIYVDPDAICIEEARWIAQEGWARIEDVKSDPYLKNKKDINIFQYQKSDDAILPITPRTPMENRNDGWAHYYEIWDRANNRVMVYFEGARDWNKVVEPWPWQELNGFPFKFLTITDSSKDLYPPSPILPWLTLVQELSFIRSMRLEHISKMVKKFVVPPGALTEEQMKDFLDPTQDLTECDNPDAIRELDGLKPDPNLYASEESVKADIREISGFSEILSGQVPFSRIAATTSSIMQRNATVRFDFYAERLGDFIIECAQDLFKIVRQSQEYPQVVELTGAEEPAWIEYTRENIEGEYQFSLDLDEMSVASKQQRIKEAFDLLTVLGQRPEIKGRSLIRDVLLAFGRTDLDDYLLPPMGPPVDPQWENQMMVQGLPVEPNPEEDFALHLQVHEQFLRLQQLPPAIQALFSEHIQKTMRLSQAAVMTGGQGRQGVNPSMQQGQALAGSQPVGGPTNQPRAAGIGDLLKAIGGQAGG